MAAVHLWYGFYSIDGFLGFEAVSKWLVVSSIYHGDKKAPIKSGLLFSILRFRPLSSNRGKLGNQSQLNAPPV
jgi:hypothetical protein